VPGERDGRADVRVRADVDRGVTSRPLVCAVAIAARRSAGRSSAATSAARWRSGTWQENLPWPGSTLSHATVRPERSAFTSQPPSR
jgi:hypothetical protein